MPATSTFLAALAVSLQVVEIPARVDRGGQVSTHQPPAHAPVGSPTFAALGLPDPGLQQAADSWAPVLASAVVPGVGQLLRDRDRGWVYLGAEAVLWGLLLERRSSGRDVAARYRDFAWEVARAPAGARRDGAFGYYETMSNWVTSGAFDLEPAIPGVQPEQDPSTFNGAVWGLAEGLFLGGDVPPGPSHPRWQQALDYYASRAAGPDFLWSWEGKEPSRQEFRGLIRRSDDALRTASLMGAGVAANHVLSAVDAWLVRKLESRAGGSAPLRITVRPDPVPGFRAGWTLTLGWWIG